MKGTKGKSLICICVFFILFCTHAFNFVFIKQLLCERQIVLSHWSIKVEKQSIYFRNLQLKWHKDLDFDFMKQII